MFERTESNKGEFCFIKFLIKSSLALTVLAVFLFVVEQASKTMEQTIKEKIIFILQNNKYPPLQ
jgi:hypothetical protein